METWLAQIDFGIPRDNQIKAVVVFLEENEPPQPKTTRIQVYLYYDRDQINGLSFQGLCEMIMKDAHAQISHAAQHSKPLHQ